MISLVVTLCQFFFFNFHFNMVMKIILILTLFINLGSYSSIQAEIIRGVDIPRLNVTRVGGKWYLLTELREDKRLACSTNVIDRQSDYEFTMRVSHIFIPEAYKYYPNTPNKPVDIVIEGTIQNDSSIIITRNNHKKKSMIMFDLERDVYMAMYLTTTKEQMFHGNNGLFYVIGRRKSLTDKVIEKFTQSVFFQQGIKPDAKFTLLDASRCP